MKKIITILTILSMLVFSTVCCCGFAQPKSTSDIYATEQQNKNDKNNIKKQDSKIWQDIASYVLLALVAVGSVAYVSYEGYKGFAEGENLGKKDVNYLNNILQDEIKKYKKIELNKEKTQEEINKLNDNISEAYEKLGFIVGDQGYDAGKKSADILENVKSFGNSTKYFFQKALTATKDGVGNVGNSTKYFFKKAWTATKGGIGNVGNSLQNVFSKKRGLAQRAA